MAELWWISIGDGNAENDVQILKTFSVFLPLYLAVTSSQMLTLTVAEEEGEKYAK